MEQSTLDLLVGLVLDIKKDVAEIKENALVNTVELKEHARRSTASEERLDLQEQKLEKFMEKMEPVQDHVKTVHGLMKFGVSSLKVLGVIASLTGATVGLIRLFR